MTPPGHWITQVNGNWVDSVSVRDRGLAYGDGLFETMRYQQGHLPLWTYHLDRLRLGCTRLRIPLNETLLEHSLKSFISRLEEQGVSSALVKLTVTRGCGGRGYAPPWLADTQPSMIFQSQPISGSGSLATSGIALQLCHT